MSVFVRPIGHSSVRLDAGGRGINWNLRHVALSGRNSEFRSGHLRIGPLRTGTPSIADPRLDGVSPFVIANFIRYPTANAS